MYLSGMGQWTHDPYAMAENWVMSQKEKWADRIFAMVDQVRADAEYAARVLDPNNEGHNQMVTWLYNNPSAAFEDYYKVGNPGYAQLQTSYLSPYAEQEWDRTVKEHMDVDEQAKQAAERLRREALYDWYADEETDDAGDEEIVVPVTPDIPPETYTPVKTQPTAPPVTTTPVTTPTITDGNGDQNIISPVSPIKPTVTAAPSAGLDFKTIAMVAGGFLLLNMLRK